MKDNVKWTIVKGHSRRGNGLERVVLFVLFRDFSSLSNSNSFKQATAKSDNLLEGKTHMEPKAGTLQSRSRDYSRN